jgi:hypothetical protein
MEDHNEERLSMNEQTENLSYSPLDSQTGLKASGSGIAEGVAIPIAADRLYQFAALTAGLFLLATLL